MITRRQLAVGAAGLAALAVAVPLGISQGGGTIDIFVGSTPTPTGTATATPTPTPTPDPGTANLFVVNGAGSCTRSSSAIDYAASSSPDRRCGTFDIAIAAMSGGDTAIIRSDGGTFSAPNFSATDDATKSPPVTLKVAAGQTVSGNIGSEKWCTSGVTLDGTTGTGGENGHQGITAGGGWSLNCDGAVNDVTFKGIYSPDGGGWYGWDCHDILMQDITMENETGGADAMQFAARGGDGGEACSDFTIDRVNIYNYQCPGTNADHQDDLQWLGGDRLTVKNSKWIGMECLYVSGAMDHGVMGLFLSCSWASCDDIVIENNLFANIAGDDGAEIAAYYADGIIFRNNTIVDNVGATTIKTETSPAPMTNVTFVNNVTDASCSNVSQLHGMVGAGGHWANNVTASSCGFGAQGDTVATGTWNNQFAGVASTLAGSADGDWTLASGAFAIGKASATYAPATDWQGGTRDGSPDAGFDEFGAP